MTKIDVFIITINITKINRKLLYKIQNIFKNKSGLYSSERLFQLIGLSQFGFRLNYIFNLRKRYS